MLVGFPLYEGGCDALHDKPAFGRNADHPLKLSTRHDFDMTQRQGGCGAGIVDIVGSGYPCGKSCWLAGHAVQLEPAGPVRWKSFWIDGDDFQIDVITQLEQQIVRSHAGMFAARLRRHTQDVFHISRALGQRGGRNDDMVDARTWHELSSLRMYPL